VNAVRHIAHDTRAWYSVLGASTAVLDRRTSSSGDVGEALLKAVVAGR